MFPLSLLRTFFDFLRRRSKRRSARHASARLARIRGNIADLRREECIALQESIDARLAAKG